MIFVRYINIHTFSKNNKRKKIFIEKIVKMSVPSKLLVVTNRESANLAKALSLPGVVHLDPWKMSVLLNQNEYTVMYDKETISLEDIKYAYFPAIDVVPCHNLMFFLESIGITCIPNSQSFLNIASKFKAYVILQQSGLPIIPTMYGSSININCGNVQRALNGPNVVKKPDNGSLGFEVKIVDREKSQELENKYIPVGNRSIFQKYVTPNTEKRYDLRLIVYDGRVLCAEKRFSGRDFRTNLSLGNRGEAYAPTKEECELAIKAVDAFEGLKVGGVDLIYDNDELKILEINSFPGDIICKLTGVNFYEEIVKDLLSK